MLRWTVLAVVSAIVLQFVYDSSFLVDIGSRIARVPLFGPTGNLTHPLYPYPSHYWPYEQCECLDLGDLNLFNGIFKSSFKGSSDVQGKLAIGGDATFAAGFSVADNLTHLVPCQEATLVVGGSLSSWPSGRNYHGNIVVGKPGYSVGSVLDNRCNITVYPNFYNFTRAEKFMKDLSSSLAAKRATVTGSVSYTDLSLHFESGECQVQVFNAPNANFFSTDVRNVLPLTNYRTGSILVINIPGKTAAITSTNLENLARLPVVFNFFEATEVTIREVAVRGYILAPHAKINAGTGVVWGSVYADSFDGPLQLNWAPINPCHRKPQPDCPVDFGVMHEFNAIFHGGFHGQSDTEGKLAIGGNAVFAAGYSVGDKLKNITKCSQYTLIVNGSLTWPSGRNYFGNVAIGVNDTSKLGVITEQGCSVDYKPDFLDFDAIRRAMIERSNELRKLRSTIKATVLWTDLTLHLSGSSFAEVLYVDDPKFFSETVKNIAAIHNYVHGAVIVFNIPGHSVNVTNLNLEKLKGLPVIFNFFQAETLEISGVAVYGHVIAPHARASSTGGVLWGSIYAYSNYGALQYNLVHHDFCKRPCPPPRPPPHPCFPIGPLADWNVITRKDYSGSSDIQGRMAVGGDAMLANGFSVGDQWMPKQVCKEAVAVVKGKITGWKTGRAYFGDVVVGVNNSDIGPYVSDCKVVFDPLVDPNYVNFTAAHLVMEGLSSSWKSRPSTSTFSVSYTDMYITLSGKSSVEVIDIKDPELFLTKVKRILTPANYKLGAVLVFNIAGAKTGITNMNMEALANIPVVFNFYEATHVSIGGVAVRGYVIAPKADIHNAQGVIWGSVYAHSLSGSVQVQHVPWPEFCIPGHNYMRPIPPYHNKHGLLINGSHTWHWMHDHDYHKWYCTEHTYVHPQPGGPYPQWSDKPSGTSGYTTSSTKTQTTTSTPTKTIYPGPSEGSASVMRMSAWLLGWMMLALLF